VVEGEPDAIAATSAGLPAVGVPGSSSWRVEWAERFSDRDVVICCDCDGPGRGLAARAADDLVQTARSVRVMDLAAARDDGYDLGAFVAESGDPEQAGDLLRRASDDAPLFLREDDRPPRPRLSVVDWSRALGDYFDSDSPVVSWPIPFAKLADASDGGMRPGELWVLAGYTSHGKSIYGDMTLDLASSAGARCHLYMTEMTLVQRGLRMISRRLGVPMTKLRRKDLTDWELDLVREEVKRLPYGASIVTDWAPRHVAMDIQASRTQVAVVDLLHGFHYENERQLSLFVHEFANAAASDAGGGGCAVMLLCHLNDIQMKDSRSARRPKPGMHSLKGASAIKQRADTVMFTWLEDDEDGVPTEDGAVWIAKGRNGGAAGSQKVRLDTKRLVFEEAF
jgi:hypothetical protein